MTACPHLSDGEDELAGVRLPGRPDEVHHLVVCHGGDLSAVDDDHLVPLIETGHTLVCRSAHGHPADYDRNTLVSPALHIEPEASLRVRIDGDGDDSTAGLVLDSVGAGCDGVPAGVWRGQSDGARLAGRFTGSSDWKL